MKKVGVILFIMMGLFLMGDRPAFAGEIKITIGVNDLLIDLEGQEAKILDGTGYSPVNPMLKGLQGTTTYDANKKIYTTTKNNKTLSFSITDNLITGSDGTTYPNLIKDVKGVPYIPIRLVGEYFGFTVKFLAKDKVVRVFNENHKLSDEQFIAKHRKALDKYFHILPSKVVYLTFDDGPNGYTAKILDILKKKEAQATFFMIEKNIKRYPDVVKRMAKEGNSLGLHSVTHDKNKIYAKPQNVAKEMEATRKTLLAVSGFDTRLTRVPYGSKPYMTQAYRDDMAKNKFKMWDWTVDTEDWKYAKNPKKVVDAVKNGIKKLDGKNKPIVILMHDSKTTVTVLPEIIDTIRKAGYEPVRYNPDKHIVVNYWGDKRL